MGPLMTPTWERSRSEGVRVQLSCSCSYVSRFLLVSMNPFHHIVWIETMTPAWEGKKRKRLQ